VKTIRTVAVVLLMGAQFLAQVRMAYGEMPAAKTQEVVAGNTAFALNLYDKLRTSQGNLFFSPYSISTALAMTYAGARGDTARQMANVLQFPAQQEQLHEVFAELGTELNSIQKNGKVQIDVANSLWPQEKYPFLPGYIGLLKQYYSVSVTPLDYAKASEPARKTINDWVEDKTNHKIVDLIKPGMLDSLTRLVLANAVYFKGSWASQFDPGVTRNHFFHLASGPATTAKFMNREGDYPYSETPDLQALELPYIGGRLSMVVLLPRAADGLAALERELTEAKLQQWTGALLPRKVLVLLPKFKLTREFSLRKTLTAMGMTDAFNPLKADFSGMDGQTNWLYISDVVHKAFVDVNEEGTEAAAATAVISVLGVEPVGLEFDADHPFLFLIRDNHTGSILFIGRVMDPTE